jgi:hypothetical protein
MTKSTVAVIGGTGAEGSGLAVRWAAAGHPVVIGSRSAEKAAAVSAELQDCIPDGGGSITGMTNADAAAAAEIVVLSVPYDSQAPIIDQIAAGCAGKVFVTVSVPLKPPHVATVWRPPGGSAAEEAQTQLGPDVRVVTAYQNVAAGHLKDLAWESDSDVLITGDDSAAKKAVAELVRESGFYAIDAGPLANAGVIEGLTAVLIGINIRHRAGGTGIRVTGLVRD